MISTSTLAGAILSGVKSTCPADVYIKAQVNVDMRAVKIYSAVA